MNYIEIFITTMKISTVATLMCFSLSLILIFISINFKKINFFIDILTSLPLALPPVISGYFLVFISGGKLSFEWIGGSIACAIISLPLVYKMIYITILSVDKEIINTSRILGADKKRTFLYVIFPMIKTGLISALFLGFIRSISEFGATMIVAGNISGKTQTLSTAIYTSIQTGNNNSILVLSIISVSIAIVSIVIFNFINKKTI